MPIQSRPAGTGLPGLLLAPPDGATGPGTWDESASDTDRQKAKKEPRLRYGPRFLKFPAPSCAHDTENNFRSLRFTEAALVPCFGAFSSSEPATTSLENALAGFCFSVPNAPHRERPPLANLFQGPKGCRLCGSPSCSLTLARFPGRIDQSFLPRPRPETQVRHSPELLKIRPVGHRKDEHHVSPFPGANHQVRRMHRSRRPHRK